MKIQMRLQLGADPWEVECQPQRGSTWLRQSALYKALSLIRAIPSDLLEGFVLSVWQQ